MSRQLSIELDYSETFCCQTTSDDCNMLAEISVLLLVFLNYIGTSKILLWKRQTNKEQFISLTNILFQLGNNLN